MSIRLYLAALLLAVVGCSRSIKPGELIAPGLSVEDNETVRTIGNLFVEHVASPDPATGQLSADTNAALARIAALHRATARLYLQVEGRPLGEDCEASRGRAQMIVATLIEQGGDETRLSSTACPSQQSIGSVGSRDGTLELIASGSPQTARQQLSAISDRRTVAPGDSQPP